MRQDRRRPLVSLLDWPFLAAKDLGSNVRNENCILATDVLVSKAEFTCSNVTLR